MTDEAALLFPSGYQTNIGVLTALAGPGDVIVSDALNHASIIDGCRLSRARIVVYPHGDGDAAAHLLEAARTARRRFLVTESLFSMNGDAAPLARLAQAADVQDAILIVDEAHAFGVLGPRGRGLCAAAGVVPDVLIGTLGKALAAAGGFAAGSRALRDLLVNRARSFIFTTAPPPPVAAAALAALEIVDSSEGDRRRALLRSHTDRLASQLAALRPKTVGTPPDTAPGSPIQPFVVGTDAAALTLSAALASRQIFVPAIRPPTVPLGSARLRITLSAAHLTRRPRPPARGAESARMSPGPFGRGLFVTGTDTGVGKTLVSVALLRLAQRRGLRPIPFKPAETGCDPHPADARALWLAARPSVPEADVCLYALRLPAAPAQAAAAEGVRIDLQRIAQRAGVLAAAGRLLIVEGAGGLLVPYAAGVTCVEIAARLELPLLIVARTALGTVNHTALTLKEAARASLEVAGVILNRTTAAEGPHETGNAALITELTGQRPLGTVPWLPPEQANDPDAVADALVTSIGEPVIDKLLGSRG